MNGNVKILLWLIYVALLAVLLPHTAWAFGQFEPDYSLTWPVKIPGIAIGWIGALAFEGAIFAFTVRLKQAIERATGSKNWFTRQWRRYGNIYTLGVFITTGISSAANWAHAVEFGQAFVVFADYSVPPNLYSIAFGGILPFCSVFFARILAQEQEAETQEDEALSKAKSDIRTLRQELNEVRQARIEAENRFAAVGDLFVRLMADDKRERILAAYELWPDLPQRQIAYITGASDGYVSDVITSTKIEVIDAS